MKSPTYFLWIASGLALIGLVLNGCEYDPSPAVWTETLPPGANPVILRVEPSGSAFANYSEIKLIGENFLADTSQNTVYFGNQRGRVLSATQNQLTVVSPPLVGDSITIQVVVSGALLPARFTPYKLEYVNIEYGGFALLEVVQAMCLDREENLYTQMSDKSVFKTTPGGVRTIFGSISFPRASDMKVGHGGYLYLQGNVSKDIFRIAPEGGAAVKWVSLPKPSLVFDFGADHTLYCAGNKTGICLVKTDASVQETGIFVDHDVRALRVVQGAVYIMGQYLGKDTSVPKAGIWRSVLAADGTPGEIQLVLDWSATGAYAGMRYLAMEFAQDDDIYIATNADDPVLVLHPGGTTEPLYPGLLSKYYTQMEWGNGSYLYANRSSQSGAPRFHRISMGKAGMPLNGRQ